MSSKNWVMVKRGLSEDAKHREKMGNRIWVFLHIIDRCHWDTGIVYGWKDKDEAEDMGMPRWTLTKQRQELAEAGYITCVQRWQKIDIVIHNWINPRNYSGGVLNPKGSQNLLPLDEHGSKHGSKHPPENFTTPTLGSGDQVSGKEREHPPTLSLSPDVSQPVTETPSAQEAPQGAEGGQGVSQGESGAARATAKRGKRQGGNGKGSAGGKRDPLLDHPAVLAYRDVAHLTPNHEQRAEIVRVVGDDPARVAEWRETVRAWMLSRWKPGNVAGMLDKLSKNGNGRNGRANIRGGAVGAGGKENGRDRERDQEIIAQTERNRRELEAISDPVERQRRWEEMLGLR